MTNYTECKEDLESLKGYQEFLCDKYPGLASPFHKKPKQIVIKEADRVAEKIREMEYCKRHKGKLGLDCYLCKLEGKFS